MTLVAFVVRRLISAFLLVLFVSSAATLLTLAAPGDFLDSDPPIGGLSPAQIQQARADLGLDRPWTEQYRRWMSGVLRFDFGQSLKFQRPVSSLLGERAANTAVLASAALASATIIGIPLGVYVAGRSGSLSAHVVRTVSLILVSMPPLLGSLLLTLAAARTGWLPAGGMTSSAPSGDSWFSATLDVLWHLPVPALALALPLAATLERLQSHALLAARRAPFVVAAQARGLSADRALLTHGWRASLSSVLGLYGVMIGALFSGSFVVEVVTGWPGIGRLMFDALKARDIYLVAGCATTGTLFLAAGTLLADLLLAAADPRVLTSRA